MSLPVAHALVQRRRPRRVHRGRSPDRRRGGSSTPPGAGCPHCHCHPRRMKSVVLSSVATVAHFQPQAFMRMTAAVSAGWRSAPLRAGAVSSTSSGAVRVLVCDRAARDDASDGGVVKEWYGGGEGQHLRAALLPMKRPPRTFQRGGQGAWVNKCRSGTIFQSTTLSSRRNHRRGPRKVLASNTLRDRPTKCQKAAIATTFGARRNTPPPTGTGSAPRRSDRHHQAGAGQGTRNASAPTASAARRTKPAT